MNKYAVYIIVQLNVKHVNGCSGRFFIQLRNFYCPDFLHEL